MSSTGPDDVRVQADCGWHDALDDCAAGLSWSFDAARLAAASVSGRVAIWDAAAGQRLAKPQGHHCGCMAVEFAAGGHSLATAGQDGHARLWDVSGAEIAALEAGAPGVEHLAWHPRGQSLATAAGKYLRIWDNGGRLVRELPGHSRTIAGLAWGSSGDCLASAANDEVPVWRWDRDIAVAAPSFSRPLWRGASAGRQLAPAWRHSGHRVVARRNANRDRRRLRQRGRAGNNPHDWKGIECRRTNTCAKRPAIGSRSVMGSQNALRPGGRYASSPARIRALCRSIFPWRGSFRVA